MPLGAQDSFNVRVAGIGEVPVSNVAGVVLNVTATDTTAASFVTVYPAGGSLPVVSNINFVPNQTIPNHVTVGVGTNGEITVYNDAGSVDIIVDVVGYYVTGAGPTGAGYFPRFGTPRVVDTRAAAPIPPFGTFTLTIPGASASGITAAVYNVTVDRPTANGYITTYPYNTPRPDTSSINFTAGQASANLVTTKLGSSDGVTFFNGSGGTVHLIVDGIGLYTTSPNGHSYIVRPVPTGPFRLWDSRVQLSRPLDPHETFIVTGSALPVATTVGLLANLTVTQPSAGGYATVFPGASIQPPSSNLNFAPNETRANQVIPALLGSTTRDIAIYNDVGTAHYIIDVFAYLQLD